jgi:transposase
MPERPYSREQEWLLPPSLDELIPADHVVRFIAAFVDNLDFAALGLVPTQVTGAPAYAPEVLVAAWIYGFMLRVRSSRKIEVAAQESIPLIWLLGRHRPDHSTLARFFQTNRQAMKGLFRQTVGTAVQVGLVDFALQAVDGTKVSVLSSDKALSRQGLLALAEKTEQAIANLERAALAEEERGAGGGQTPRLPKDLTDARRLQEQVQAALSEVDKRDAARVAHHAGEVDDETGKPIGPKVHPADPQTVVMKGRHGFVLGYNAQAVVDSKAQIIVGADVVAEAADAGCLLPMLREAEETTGQGAAVSVADAGYHAAQALAEAEETGRHVYVADPILQRGKKGPGQGPYHKEHFRYDAATDTFTCPQGRTLCYAYTRKGEASTGARRIYTSRDCRQCPHMSACTKDRRGRRVSRGAYDDALQRNRDQIRSAAVQDLLRQRSRIIEPVFAVIREQQGLTRFLRRGWDNVRAEWYLLSAAYNLLKVWRLHWRAAIQTT